MPRLRKKGATRSERDGAKGRARKGGERTGPCRPRRQAKRAASVSERRRQGSLPEGRRPRSGLRGAGRGEAAPGGIEPGDRSEGPGGRPDVPAGQTKDTGPASTADGEDGQAEEVEDSPRRASRHRLLAALDAILGRAKRGGVADGGARSATLGPAQKIRCWTIRPADTPLPEFLETGGMEDGREVQTSSEVRRVGR